MDRATSVPGVRRLLVAGLVVLIALLAAIGASGLGSANAAETSGASAPSYQPVQSSTPDRACTPWHAGPASRAPRAGPTGPSRERD